MTKSIEEIRKVKKDIEPELLKIPGVTGVGIGKKTVAGQKQDEIGIKVYVNKKKKEDEIPGTELIPKEKNGVKTDVVELTPNPVPYSQQYGEVDKNLVDILKGGINIGTPIMSGTLGAIVLDKNTQPPQPLILSNCHILRPTLTSAPGDPIYNPGDNPSHNVASLYDAKINEYMDAGVATINNSANINIECGIEGIGPVNGFVDVRNTNTDPDNIPVKKRGITTKVTSGTIIDCNFTFTVPYSRYQMEQVFVDQILIQPDPPNPGGAFSLLGDSGSAIVGYSDRVVGLLIAGDENPQRNGIRYSYANHILPILDAFNISICTQA